MKTNSAFIILILLIVQGCSSNKLTLLEDNEDCGTVVEGFYKTSRIWNTMAPAFILKNKKFKLASELRRDSLGIYFLEKKTRIFQSSDTLFYPYSEIQTVVDSSRFCTYGDIPERYFYKGIKTILHLKYDRDSALQPVYLELEPNEHFAYCVPPGKYTISKIEFLIKENISEGIDLPELEFTAAENKANYLGSIYLANNEQDSAGAVTIPYKITYNAGDAAAVGFMFGMIGSAIYYAAKSGETEIDGYYRIQVKSDTAYIYQSRQEHSINLIQTN